MASIEAKNGANGTAVRTLAGDVALSENATNVLRARYLIKDETGKCTETPKAMFERVASAVADAELLYDEDTSRRNLWQQRFYELMISGQFMPNSPTLMNAGREMGMLSACFVLPVRDSIHEIFDSIKHTALIQKAGGGTGFAFDELRPTGDYIRSSGGTTSGPISFWRAFSEATNAIQQGAFRRGANMGMMYIDHPDILKFLYAKQDLNQFNNYNISVKVTDAWMDAYRSTPDAPHQVRNPRTGRRYYLPKKLDIWSYTLKSLIDVESDPQGQGDYYANREIWNIIIQHAWQTGEPGVVFVDRVNQHNPTPHVGRIEATNPCGEQPLLPYEACNLGSINLAKFITTDEQTGHPAVDWDELRTAIHFSTRFLDDVIDANNYPLPEIDAMCKGNRKIGLGVMGFADARFMLGSASNSKEGVAWGERFMKFVNDESHAYSEQLARQRGCFPNWKGSLWDTKHHRPMRNACCTTVAPTGTISIIANCSCGIEPLFSLVFYRHVLKGQTEGDKPMIEVNEVFRRCANERGLLSEEILDRIARDGTLAHITSLPEEVRRVFVSAHDVTPEWHVRMQAGFQRHCDASISKTINFPESATADDVETIYRLCYETGCKGVTVYRDGCRKSQPMARKDETDKKTEQKKEAMAEKTVAPAATSAPSTSSRPHLEPADLPELVSSVRVKQMTPFGNMHVQVTVDPRRQQELEVFAQLGKGGDLANSDLEAICRMVSLWLRAGGRLTHVIQQLKGIGSSLQVSTKEGKIMSLGDGLARALDKYARARAHFGIHALLVGDFEADELDRIMRGRAAVPANGNGRNGTGRNAHATGGGNGHGNGAGNDRHNPTLELAAVGTGSSATHDDGQSYTATEAPRSRNLRSSSGQAEAFKVICPECQAPLNYTEGCVLCQSCGYSHC